jgi:hypothetical protein
MVARASGQVYGRPDCIFLHGAHPRLGRRALDQRIATIGGTVAEVSFKMRMDP